MNPWSDATRQWRTVALVALIAFSVGAATAATSVRRRLVYDVERRVESIRTEPNGDKVGTLLEGAEVRELERDGRWVRFRLEGWIWGPSLAGWTEEEEAEEEEQDGPAQGLGQGLDQRQPRAALQQSVPDVRGMVEDRYGVFYSVSYDRDLKQVVLRFRVSGLSPEALEVRQRGAQAEVVGLLADELEVASVRVETNRPDGSGPVGAQIAITPVDHVGDPEERPAAAWRAHTRRSSDGGETWAE